MSIADRFSKIDVGILISTLLLSGLGVVLVYSSSFAVAQQKFGGADFFLTRQVIRTILGIVFFVIFINIDYHVIGKLGGVAYFISIGMLIYVIMSPESHAVNGAKRWIEIGFFRFQVSEFARIALIIMMAHQLEIVGDTIVEGKVFISQLIWIGAICGLIFLEPDFSTAFLMGSLGLLLVFLSGAKFLHLATIVFAALPIMFVAVASTPYRLKRVMGFLHMTDHKQDLGYQAYQALVGMGNGGLFGVGLGQGEQKLFYLPEPHTDFVFAIMGEEIGFIGLILVLATFAFMVYRGIKISLNAPDKMGQLMAFGITFALAVYVLLHTFVNTGLVPTTGVPLPFLSYGGMNLVFTLCSMGILLNISSQSKRMSFSDIGRIRKKRKRKRF